MKQKALQFAQACRCTKEDQSEHLTERPQHPILYVFVGDCDDAYGGIQTAGAFSLRLFTDVSDESIADNAHTETARVAIRMVKTDIQRNDAHFNLKRITVFVILRADAMLFRDTRRDAIGVTGALVRDIFAEDFSIVHMTLFVLLSESNRYVDYEQRAAYAYQTLCRIETLQRDTSLFDRIFLLSDRYENDTVSDENMRNNYVIIHRLSTLSHADSRFEESLRNKSIDTGSVSFITAGMARLEKPVEAIGYAVFRHVYNCLLTALKGADSTAEWVPDITALLAQLTPTDTTPVTDRQLTNDLMSVATRDVPVGQLRGKNLRDAENLLFGENAARFFEMNYSGQRFYRIKDAPLIIWRFLEHTVPGLCAVTSQQSAVPDENMRMLDVQIEQCEHEIEKRYRETVRKPVLIIKRDAIKRMIADVYVIRYKAERLRATQSALAALDEGVRAYTRFTRRLVKAMEAAAASMAQETDPGYHITAYYKQVVDGIVAELTTRYGTLFWLQDEFLGPVSEFDANAGDTEKAPDLSPLAERLSKFIRTHIYNHESMRLSFSEDLTRRSQLTPNEYDSAFLPVDDFYRQVTADAERQAALAVSLQRYDDLIREKYYCGDIDGMLMRFIRQVNNENSSEPAYYLPATSAFWVVRLAGGFTLDNLTRYRVMQQCYNRMTGRC